jgi:hypothetical protein
LSKNSKQAGCWWLTPVILATQEDGGSKPAQANTSMKSYFEKTLRRKRAGRAAQGVNREFKPQYCQKKKQLNQKETE